MHTDYQPPADLLKDRIVLVTGAGDGIGGKDGRSLVAHVHNAQPPTLRTDQNRRDVAAAKSEQKAYAVRLESRGNDLPPVHGCEPTLHPCAGSGCRLAGRMSP
jgi:hypothetical protein